MKTSRYTNELTTTYLLAEAILSQNETENADLLLQDTPPQAALGVTNLCTLHAGGYVLLDFGAELCGGAELTVQQTEGTDTQLRLVFGESVMEAMSSVGEKNATNDHAPRDITVTATKYSHLRLGQTGFRFLRIEAVGGAVELAGVRAASQLRNVTYRGSFETDDALLNRIWQVGARTVHLNMQEYLWDGIKRDRLVWVGDMHAEISAVAAVFGSQSVVEKSLDLVQSITPPQTWMNGIPSYSFWWIIILRDWFLYTGNLAYLQQHADYLYATVRHILSQIREDGTETFTRPSTADGIQTYFVDWETNGTPESKVGFYAVLSMALTAAAELCRRLGNESLADACINGKRCLQRAALPQTDNKQMAALAVLAGLADAKEVNKNVLMQEPIEDVTAYLGYYTLLAKGMAGDIDGALHIIRRYWGRMLELGATSFWEAFNLRDAEGAPGIDRLLQPGETDIHGDFGAYCYTGRRCSLCHGWACGPTPFLSRYVLGVQPLAPGCKTLSVRPQLGSLHYAKGSFPTPYGDVQITAEQTANGLQTEISAPKEIEIVKGE